MVQFNQTNTVEMEIVINNVSFPVDSQLLQTVAQSLPSSQQYQPLVNALLKLNNKELFPFLAELIDLTQDNFDWLWQHGDRATRRTLVDSAKNKNLLVQLLSDEQMEQIVKDNDVAIMSDIAYLIYSFVYPDDASPVRRCTKASFKRLIRHMVQLDNPEIKEVLRASAKQRRIDKEFGSFD